MDDLTLEVALEIHFAAEPAPEFLAALEQKLMVEQANREREAARGASTAASPSPPFWQRLADLLRPRPAAIAFVLLLILLLPLLGGCQDDELPDEVRTLNDAYKVIVGEWEWTKSRVGDRFSGIIIQTSESEGTTRRYVFRRDRSMQFIVNGIVIQDSEYSLDSYDDLFLLRVEESGSSLPMSFRGETLSIYNLVFAHTHDYIRR